MRKTAKSLWISVMALLLCFSMLLGTTYAWFTDTVESGNNVIIAGNLDVEMYWSKDLSSGNWINAEDANAEPIFNHDKWEPGYTEVRYVKIVNAGNLALKYGLSIIPDGEVSILADVIDVYYVENATENIADRNLTGLTSRGTLRDAIIGKIPVNGVLLPNGKTPANGQYAGEVVIAIALQMDKDAGNEYMNKSIGDSFSIQLVASQYNYESDSFDSDYDSGVELPAPIVDSSVSTNVTPDADNKVPAGGATLDGGSISANVPAGVQMEQGATSLTLSVSNIENSNANITLGENEVQSSIDVHMEGVATSNSVPMEITLLAVAAKGMNFGNLKLYHVENDSTNEMTYVALDAAFTAHNQFKYDPATGDIILYMATFSEIAVVADTVNPWEGKFDYTWYDASKTELAIANADQLAAFGAIVGGMAKKVGEGDIYTSTGVDENATIVQDSFSGKTVKLLADINLGYGVENHPYTIFYPIGYNSNDGKYEKTGEAVSTGFYNFCGTFDGNGHTVSNFYHNTWEMKGDHNWYSPEEQYYRDGMGLFGKIYGGTVKNLTVKNFSSDGEIATTGVIAAYADGATFENIAIFNCNPRVYNIGNGGIVGCVGWYAKEADLKTTFKNITVDNSNKISALWGSYDVACGGIVGQYYPTSGQTSAGTPKNAGVHFENCHVSAQMDVYNDVCANYQYYAYRYTGMLIGSVRENVTENGHSYPKMDGITAKDCTVHFGTWNDYYYCEIIDNTTASYTHDYQMSRLTEIKAIDGTTITYLDGTTGTVPASGRANYVIVDYTKGHGTENATCYHFKDGKVWNHSDAGTEIVDGKEVLVEDKQHIYLEFNNLVTGYGWGVTTKGVGDLAGVTILDRQEGNSVEKFEDTGVTELPNGISISIGDLFSFVDKGVKLVPGALSVGVHNLDKNNPVSATIVYDRDNWENGTITFTGTGKITITIQDYYFCTPTSFEVEIVEASEYDMFSLVFPNTDKYLYRVGNQNAVDLKSLFKAKLNNTVSLNAEGLITVEVVDSLNVSGTYTPNSSDWNNGTIKFNNTGIVKVTIKLGNDIPVKELYLEVVEATNITSATAGTGKNFVLLQDVTYSDTYLYYKKSTLYGNGFTIDITRADHSDLKYTTDKDSNKSAYCNIWMVDSRFDNVRIVGSVYPEVGMTADSDYGNAAIRTEGECYITNSYISNCRVPIRVQGNTTLINTVVDGGRYANIELRSGKLTLDGVTTINTVRKGSDGTTDVIGFGIVIHSEAANASIAVIGDGLKQYNWVGENKHKTILSGDTNLSSAYKLIFNANNSNTIYFSKNNDRYVNTGILCLCAGMNKDVVTGLNDRYCQEVSGYDAWVLTYDNSKHTTWFDESIAVETVEADHEQQPVIPTYTGNEAQTVEFTKGETYYFDTSVLKAEKFGQSLTISSVVMNGTEYNYGDKIPLTEGGTYEVVYTVVDPYNYNADATSNTVKPEVSITVTAIAKDAEILAPKFTFIDQNGNKYESTTVKVGDKTYVMPNVTAADPTTNSMSSINIGSASISGTTVYFPVAKGYTVRSGSNFNRYYPLFNGINITDYTIAGDTTGTTYTTSGNYTSLVGSSGTKFIIPANGGQTNCGDYVKTNGQAGNAAGNSDSGWQGSGYSTSYDGTYLKSGNTNASSGTDSNGYERIVWVEYCFNAGNGDVYYYRIGYHCNKESAQSCVTGDTLVTIADGTQVRVDSLTGNEELLVWNHETGKLDKAPVAYIVDHNGVVSEREIIHLNFANGKTVKIIGEHVFFDATFNKYVAVNTENVDSFIGHTFVALGSDGETVEKVELVSIEREITETTVYEVVSYKHLTCFTEGILSTSAYLDPLLNTFDIDSESLAYDAESVQKDIETYGLYTYADFEGLISEEAFELYNAAYLKIAIGKGYITWDDVLEMIDIYFDVDVQPIQ